MLVWWIYIPKLLYNYLKEPWALYMYDDEHKLCHPTDYFKAS